MLLHDRTKRILQNYLQQPAPGLAIIGEQGSGKEYLAHYIAGELLKINNTQTHPYIHSIDARTTTGAIEAVRQLQKTLSLGVPGDAKTRRAVLILGFDAFGHEAQNAMLKTLEEPPKGTVFLLTIDRPGSVLPTIYSRVQQLHVLPISLPTALQTYPSAYEQLIKKAHQISGGSAGLLTGLIDNSADHSMIMSIAEAKRVLQMPKHVRIASVDSLIKSKEIGAVELLDAILRIVKASQDNDLAGSDRKAQILSNKRVTLVLGAIKDIQSGVGQKLVLTRLFLDL